MTKPLTFQLENGQSINLESEKSEVYGKDFDKLPIVDLKLMFSDNIEDRRIVAKELHNACINVGFMYVINHGIRQDIIDDAFLICKTFFDLPEEEKMSVFTGLAPVDQYTGYHPLGKYNRGGRKYSDLSEAFNWNYDPQFDPITPPKKKANLSFKNMWPSKLPQMKNILMRYHTECLTLARTMIKLVALAFDLPEDYFNSYIQAPSAGMRIIHYPKQEHDSGEQNGIGPHTDFQALTLVNPGGVSGLQVVNKRGHWIEAPPLEGALIVNVGDSLMRITNSKYVSTVHRVVNKSGVTRYSIPFFFGFDYEQLLYPIPGCVDETNPNRYELMTSVEYIKWRGKVAKINNKEILEILKAKGSL